MNTKNENPIACAINAVAVFVAAAYTAANDRDGSGSVIAAYYPNGGDADTPTYVHVEFPIDPDAGPACFPARFTFRAAFPRADGRTAVDVFVREITPGGNDEFGDVFHARIVANDRGTFDYADVADAVFNGIGFD